MKKLFTLQYSVLYEVKNENKKVKKIDLRERGFVFSSFTKEVLVQYFLLSYFGLVGLRIGASEKV